MLHTTKSKRLLLISAAAGAFAAAGSAAAQTAAGPAVLDAAAPVVAESTTAAAATQVTDVIVTARRTTERAQDVPISLSVVSKQTLAATGGYTLTDLQNDTPSFVAYNSNPRNSSVAIRGIGLSSASDGLDYSVGVYVDGVYLGRPGMALA